MVNWLQPGGSFGTVGVLPERQLVMVSGLPSDQAASALSSIANYYVRLGQWPLAREVFLVLVERFPEHPLTADAFRWAHSFALRGSTRAQLPRPHFVRIS